MIALFVPFSDHLLSRRSRDCCVSRPLFLFFPFPILLFLALDARLERCELSGSLARSTVLLLAINRVLYPLCWGLSGNDILNPL
jgi:hypothetical protein